MSDQHEVSMNLSSVCRVEAALKDPGGIVFPSWRTLQRAASRPVGTPGPPGPALHQAPRRVSARHARVRAPRQRIVLGSVFLAASLAAQTPVEVVRVTSKAVERQVKLPGEFRPYLGVPISAKVTGFVEKVEVDRGSPVKEGDVLATLVAPEMQAQILEAQSKAQAVELQRAEALA